MLSRSLLVAGVAGVLVAACNGGSAGSMPPGPPPPDHDQIAVGRPLYDRYCASCHGIRGEGVANWKTPNADGSYPPPPHDATGHTWHHSDALIVELVANGSGFTQSRMPTFGDTLDDDQILAILQYIKTWWGPEELEFQWQVTQSDR